MGDDGGPPVSSLVAALPNCSVLPELLLPRPRCCTPRPLRRRTRRHPRSEDHSVSSLAPAAARRPPVRPEPESSSYVLEFSRVLVSLDHRSLDRLQEGRRFFYSCALEYKMFAHQCAESAHQCEESAHRCAEFAHRCATGTQICAPVRKFCAPVRKFCAPAIQRIQFLPVPFMRAEN